MDLHLAITGKIHMDLRSTFALTRRSTGIMLADFGLYFLTLKYTHNLPKDPLGVIDLLFANFFQEIHRVFYNHRDILRFPGALLCL